MVNSGIRSNKRSLAAALQVSAAFFVSPFEMIQTWPSAKTKHRFSAKLCMSFT
jgi:hypothetical protein